MRNDWQIYSPAIEAAYSPWLHDHGSLTLRIRQRCEKFHVQNVYNGLSLSSRDETDALQLPRRQNIYTRDVFLYADGKPVVFAHSVVAAQHLRGAWHTLQHLGSRPLGALLFSHPLVQRAPLRYKALKSRHPLYRHAVQALDSAPSQLWARRSVFTLHGTPLLVTEVFLPEILKLQQQL
jgi:chorismate--pyruvate lyase